MFDIKQELVGCIFEIITKWSVFIDNLKSYWNLVIWLISIKLSAKFLKDFCFYQIHF